MGVDGRMILVESKDEWSATGSGSRTIQVPAGRKDQVILVFLLSRAYSYSSNRKWASAPTYNGTTMTWLTRNFDPGYEGSTGSIQVAYLENPDVGSHSFAYTMTSSSSSNVTMISRVLSTSGHKGSISTSWDIWDGNYAYYPSTSSPRGTHAYVASIIVGNRAFNVSDGDTVAGNPGEIIYSDHDNTYNLSSIVGLVKSQRDSPRIRLGVSAGDYIGAMVFIWFDNIRYQQRPPMAGLL
jgi:hypothetical protein